MQIEKLFFLNDYKKFKKGDVINFSGNKTIILVGQNGSGKTTVLSMLSKLFYHIERYDKKINFDIELSYTINTNDSKTKIVLRHSSNLIEISVNGSEFKGVVPMTNSNKINYSCIRRETNLSIKDVDENFLKIKDIKKYLPNKVIGSIFSVQAEYPTERPYNYIGELKNITHNISINSFIENNRSYGYVSHSILSMALNHDLFYKTFNLKWTGKIKVYNKSTYYSADESKIDFDGPIGIWKKVSISQIKSYKNNSNLGNGLYINDVEFLKSDKTKITLNKMSAGEKSLFMRLMGILDEAENNSLILIEEPELFLNPTWQIKYVKFITKIFNNTFQILITTHSPYILEGSKNLNTELFIFNKNKAIDKLIMSSKFPQKSINLISYQAFGIINNSLHIELFTLLEIRKGGLKNIKKELQRVPNILFKKHKATVNYPGVKIGDLVNETLPLFIRNAMHHPDEKARKYNAREFKKSVDLMISLLESNW